MKKTVKVRGNVFLEIGFPPEEAAVLKMRADLMSDLREFIRDSKLTQAAVAQRLGIGQSRVSDLVRGKWDKFSLEMLITLAARAGHKVALRVVACHAGRSLLNTEALRSRTGGPQARGSGLTTGRSCK